MTARCWLLALLLGVGPIVARSAPVHTYLLGPEASAALQATGEVRVVALDTAGIAVGTPLLTVEPVLSSRQLRRTIAEAPFTAFTRVGAPGGRRGLLHPADDDGDGVADEDPLDGSDNDGDGLVDEDFAAISDAMAVVDLPAGPHLELYHWNYPHLQRVLFLDATDREGRAMAIRFTLRPAGGTWQRLELTLRTRSWLPVAAAEPVPVWTARLEGFGQERWVGLLTLSEGTSVERSESGEELTVSGPAAATFAVAVAATPTQLLGALAEGRTVREGAPLRPGEPAMPWIVTPPPCPLLEKQSPVVCWFTRNEGWVLRLTLPTGCTWLPDPQGFRLGGEPCGAPAAIELTSGEGRVLLRASGRADGPTIPSWVASYLALAGDGAKGATLELSFPHPAPVEGAAKLQGSWPFGCGFSETALRLPTEAEVTDQGSRPPTLSPELVDGYPNPFRDHLTVAFRVPSTVGEGFVWDGDRPPGLKADDPIPYSSPLPRTTLKIYTISGREIVTLYDEPSAPGTYHVEWDGRDPTGRRVAMGTYFCKLQVDQWSVTTRVSVIR